VTGARRRSGDVAEGVALDSARSHRSRAHLSARCCQRGALSHRRTARGCSTTQRRANAAARRLYVDPDNGRQKATVWWFYVDPANGLAVIATYSVFVEPGLGGKPISALELGTYRRVDGAHYPPGAWFAGDVLIDYQNPELGSLPRDVGSVGDMRPYTRVVPEVDDRYRPRPFEPENGVQRLQPGQQYRSDELDAGDWARMTAEISMVPLNSPWNARNWLTPTAARVTPHHYLDGSHLASGRTPGSRAPSGCA
jgi:hypothetical protein